MAGKIADSLHHHSMSRAAKAHADGSDEWDAAATHLHHLNIGPGEPCISEWAAAGLDLPNLDRMRADRLARVRRQLELSEVGGVLVMDPMNIRYVSDTTNMQIWVMHNGARYAWVSADRLIVWDYFGSEFLSGHNDLITEVRPAVGHTYFLGGPRQEEIAHRFAAELIEVMTQDCGPGAKVAIDQTSYWAYKDVEAAGFTVESGQALMELARVIKTPDEITAMRCAAHACQTTMDELQAALTPGMTEREVWSMLHAGNIRRAGEWIETQILASGPRTNPWFQEASSRVIEDGDLVAYDTDLVGAYGMMIDISRTYRAGGGTPTAQQAATHALAVEQIERNAELMTAGRTFRELTFDSFVPPVDEYRHYSCLLHGVGQCDEYPEIYFPRVWDDWGFDGVLEPGMVLTVESYVGPRAGGEGVKLENQILVTENGPENLTPSSLDLV